MAETSDSAAGNDPQTSCVDQDAAQGSSDSFWHNVYSRNQDKASTSEWGDSGNGLEFAFGSSVKGAGVSSLDYEWGHVFEKSSKTKRKKKNTDVSSSSALNSPSDLSLSGALSQISKDLSLSSPSLFSSGEIDGDRENEEADSLKSLGENLQAELGQKMDTSAISAFIHYLSECNGVDMLSSDSDGDEDEIQATSVFGASESKDSCQKPEIGMEFSSEEEAYKFYEGYANKIGFRTRKGKVQRLSNGTIRKRFFFCSKQGFRLKKQADKITKYKRKETRTGCDAKIQFTVENGKWVVSQFNQEHNHHLENQRHTTRSCTKTSEARLILNENNAEMAKDAGAQKSRELCNMVCSTCVHDKTRDGKHPEEVQNLLNCLRHLQAEDLSLFYAVQLDSNNRLKNLFWRDGRSMVDYDYFGDVLILDTTFRMDKYDMICAPFWGLNHHRQYVMFGCAFLLDESKESFVWLLETFMEAMGRKQPKTIVTDENQVMVEAVKVVLLDAEHQFGAWFIRRNALKHVFAFYSQPAFESIFNACISDCQTEEEFESKWDFLLQKFNLRENAWLNNLYLSRERWANVFHKETFSAGIKWCKDIINVFQNSTSDTMNLSMFVHQYLKVVETQRLEELYEDLRCGETAKVLILSGSAMEKQAANIYTRTIFSIFQGELVKSLSVAIEEIGGDGTNATFKLTEEGQKESIVEFSCPDSNLACSCKKYESEGILCVHALKVLNARNIFHIPAQYILKRWTIRAKDSVAEDEHGQKLADQKQQPMIFLLKKTLDVIYKTSAFEDCQKIATLYLDKASKRVEAVLRAKTTDHLKSRKVSTDGLDVSLPNEQDISLFLTSSQMDFERVRGGGSAGKKRELELESGQASSSSNDDAENPLVQKKPRFSENIFEEDNRIPNSIQLSLAEQLNLVPRKVQDSISPLDPNQFMISLNLQKYSCIVLSSCISKSYEWKIVLNGAKDSSIMS
ncbi:hypothetical protein OIU85_000469 [Salix viminalis]|uniref:Protein FAR1-RELATED SEQUENCE n=1 Tax=Salix viminalis TaxID=40686 RepID=A0A9Q0VJJ5_SALVM|nr:hypothetical protein OIU85_000469 [Salix viminalis]